MDKRCRENGSKSGGLIKRQYFSCLPVLGFLIEKRHNWKASGGGKAIVVTGSRWCTGDLIVAKSEVDLSRSHSWGGKKNTCCQFSEASGRVLFFCSQASFRRTELLSNAAVSTNAVTLMKNNLWSRWECNRSWHGSRDDKQSGKCLYKFTKLQVKKKTETLHVDSVKVFQSWNVLSSHSNNVFHILKRECFAC